MEFTALDPHRAEARVELDEDSRGELRRLLDGVALSQGFDLFFLVFDSDAVLDQAVTALTARYGPRLLVCRLPQGRADVDPLVELMRTALDRLTAAEPIFLLRGLDSVLGPFGEHSATLRVLNERRDTLGVHLRGPLVVALRPQQLQQLRQHAPDLWSIHTLVCRIRGVGYQGPRLPDATQPWLDDPQKYLQQIDKLRALPGEEPTRLRALLQHRLALALAARGDVDAAERVFAAGLDAARAVAAPEIEAALLVSRGDLRRRVGDLRAAERDLRAASTASPTPSPGAAAALHQAEAALAADRSAYPEAVHHLVLAREAFERGERFEDAALCLVHEGHLLLVLAQIEAADGRFAEALRAARERQAPLVEAFALAGQADVARARGRVGDALGLYTAALEIHERLAHLPGQAQVHAALALVALGTDDLSGALQNARRAGGLWEQIGDKLGEAQALLHQARVLDLLERRREATSVLQRAEALFKSVGNRRGEAEVQLTRGTTLLQDRRPREALAPLCEAAQTFRLLSLPRDEASALRFRGDALLVLGRSSEAVECLERALALADDAVSPGDAALTWWSLGSAFRQSDPSRALDAWRQAELLARRLAQDSLVAHVLADTARLLVQHPALASDRVSARGLFDEALALARRGGETSLAQRIEAELTRGASSRD